VVPEKNFRLGQAVDRVQALGLDQVADMAKGLGLGLVLVLVMVVGLGSAEDRWELA
jgi:hypothetical protein